MSDMIGPEVLKQTIRACKMFVVVMIMGVVFFLAIFALLIPPLTNPEPALAGKWAGGPAIVGSGKSSPPLFTYVGVGMGILALAPSFVIHRQNTTRARRQIAT